MTKELLFHRMELDLDTFLNSRRIHEEDDDETDNLKSFPHRSIEDILNDSLSASDSDSDSDSDSSSSPPSLAPTPHHLLEDEDPNNSATDALPKQPLNSAIAHPDHHYKAANSFALLRPPPDRQLPSLFGGVRSTAKPGAALAAAAAASRSIPTPHATAIKSRRALPRPPLPSPTNQLQSSSSNDISRDPAGILHGSDGNDDDDKMPEQHNCNDANIDENEEEEEEEEEIVDFQSAVRDGFDSVFLPQVAVEADSHEPEEVEVQEKEVISPVHEVLSTSNTGSSVSTHEDQMHFLGSLEENSTLTSIGQEAGADAASTVAISDEKDSELGELEVEAPILHESGEDDSVPEVDKLVEERIGQLENKRVNEKKSQVTLKPLELAELAERRQASTALDWEEGAAALPMRLEGVRRGSTTLGYFDVNPSNVVTRTISSQAFRRDHGSPQVLAVHTNCIAVGMSKGIILMVPCKYSPHQPDNMESKITLLGLQGERSYAAVTAISFNQQGDLLLAGYSDGHVTVWDIQRASAAKIITGEHTAPVVHAFFLGQDSQVTRQFKAVTGDSNGLVLLHSFSVVPLLNRFTVKTQCLLDGLKTGTVLSASPLIYDELVGGTSLSSQGNSTAASSSSIGSMMGGVVGADAGWKLFNEGNSLIEEGVVIFVTYQTALVVRLSPALKVYATLSKPEGVREGSMPYAAWKSVNAPCGSSNEKSAEDVVERLSLLAIAWDRKVQVAKLVNSELKVYGKWSLDSAAIGVAWLDDQMLIVLTLTAQICLFARDGTMIHQTSFAVDGFRGDDLLTYHSQYINVFGNPEKAYHNSLAVRGASVYILGPAHLVVSRLLPWKERIQVLRKAGDWMGALNMAMTLFDGQAHGVIDLPRTLDAVQNAIMPYLVELLLSYVDEVFSYISLAYANQIGMAEHVDDQTSGSSSLQNEIKEQFARVGGVAVEFCVHIKRTDILFDEIFSKFASVQQRETFLELLEPYILKDMLSSLPPEIMQALVEHYSSKGWLQRVEQCVLHMDISSLDFNQVVKLCREHGLYCALVYLFNRGLDDFRSPLEELLAVYRNSQKETATVLGYKMLVYLKYCFSGLAFPPGHGTLPARRLPSLRAELLRFLLEYFESSNSLPDGAYLNVYHLLEIDTEASLLVFQCAFTDEEANLDISSRDSANIITETENDTAAESIKLTQELVNALIHVLDMDVRPIHESRSNETKPADMWPSSNDIGHIIEFLAYFVACKRAKVSKDVLTRILEHLIFEKSSTSGGPEQNVGSLRKRREKQVLSLLEIVPESDWEAANVLHLCEKAQFHQVCGLIHTMQDHYLAALDSYMKDTGEPIYAFAFISSTLSMLSEMECAAFRSAVITRIPGLVNLSREATLFLIVDHFSKESQQILSVLQSCPNSLFLYLKTVVEVHLYGTLDFSYLKGSDSTDVSMGKSESVLTKRLDAFFDRISDFPRFLRNNPIEVTDDMTERYLELLCQYERNSVLKFLETFDSYRVEHCLRLCQEYGIRDAAAFLLERVGDVGSALLLSLSDLNEKFAKLEMAVSNFVSEMASSSSVGSKQFNTLLKVEEVQDIIQTLHACVGLCQRNTPRLNPEESEILWFKLLDSVCEPLMGLSSNGKIAEKEKQGSSVGTEQGSDLRMSKSDGIFRKLYSQFIKEIVEGMIGYVRLPVIMSKLLSDNGSQEFGDFKLTILGMLGTYGFERRILDTAKSLIEDDTFYTMNLLKKGASHGYAPRSLMCCICSCPLSKKNSPYLSDVRVFNCGHATHIQCEVVESGNSKRGGEGSLSGCPVCLPKKSDIKGRSKSSSSSSFIGGEGETGLVAASKLPSRHYHGRTSEGSTILNALENHNDVSDSGLQQLSRFELLGVLQKEQRGSMQIENLPPLRLAPPSVYHEKVKKGIEFLSMGETSSSSSSSNGITRMMNKSSKQQQQQLKEVKVKSSSLRFPLKSSIFGKERTSRR